MQSGPLIKAPNRRLPNVGKNAGGLSIEHEFGRRRIFVDRRSQARKIAMSQIQVRYRAADSPEDRVASVDRGLTVRHVIPLIERIFGESLNHVSLDRKLLHPDRLF